MDSETRQTNRQRLVMQNLLAAARGCVIQLMRNLGRTPPADSWRPNLCWNRLSSGTCRRASASDKKLSTCKLEPGVDIYCHQSQRQVSSKENVPEGRRYKWLVTCEENLIPLAVTISNFIRHEFTLGNLISFKYLLRPSTLSYLSEHSALYFKTVRSTRPIKKGGQRRTPPQLLCSDSIALH